MSSIKLLCLGDVFIRHLTQVVKNPQYGASSDVFIPHSQPDDAADALGVKGAADLRCIVKLSTIPSLSRAELTFLLY